MWSQNQTVSEAGHCGYCDYAVLPLLWIVWLVWTPPVTVCVMCYVCSMVSVTIAPCVVAGNVAPRNNYVGNDTLSTINVLSLSPVLCCTVLYCAVLCCTVHVSRYARIQRNFQDHFLRQFGRWAAKSVTSHQSPHPHM